jgi:hypothetical protein
LSGSLEGKSSLTLRTTLFERRNKVSAQPLYVIAVHGALWREGKIKQLQVRVYQPRLLTTARTLWVMSQGRNVLRTKRQYACAYKHNQPKKRFF